MSQATWYAKLKTWVPSWVFEDEEKSEAIFQGMAKVLCEVEADFLANLSETFIDTATEDYLEEHGRERGIDRLTGESLEEYRARVKEIVNRSSCPAIKALVDSIIINGESQIVEHWNFGQFFLDREAYLNRGVIPTDLFYNAFTILVPDQTPQPVTFLSRENFLDREDILGSSESSLALFERIVEAVNKNKAFGTAYRLYERFAS